MMADRWCGADPDLQSRIVAEARCWIGTPYVHQASRLGAGADCLGLVRGVWRAVIGAEPESPGAYSADWAETAGEERLMMAAARHLVRLPVGRSAPGDVLLFRMREGSAAKHLGILTSHGVRGGRMIHAYSGHAVTESTMTEAWVRRLAAVFRFPVEDN